MTWHFPSDPRLADCPRGFADDGRSGAHSGRGTGSRRSRRRSASATSGLNDVLRRSSVAASKQGGECTVVAVIFGWPSPAARRFADELQRLFGADDRVWRVGLPVGIPSDDESAPRRPASISTPISTRGFCGISPPKSCSLAATPGHMTRSRRTSTA